VGGTGRAFWGRDRGGGDSPPSKAFSLLVLRSFGTSHLAPNGAQARFARTPHPPGARAPFLRTFGAPAPVLTNRRASERRTPRQPLAPNGAHAPALRPVALPNGDIPPVLTNRRTFQPALLALVVCSNSGQPVPQLQPSEPNRDSTGAGISSISAWLAIMPP